MVKESINQNDLLQYGPIFNLIPETLLAKLKSFKLLGPETNNALLVDEDHRAYFFGPDYDEYCSGLNSNQYDVNRDQSKPVEILNDISSVNDIVYSEHHVLVLDTRGDLYSYERGRCEAKLECLNEKNQISLVECSNSYVVALTNQGSVFCWNVNNQHQLNLDPNTKSELSRFEVKQISCGSGHTLALISLGYLFSWGRNDCGQLAFGHKSRNVKNPTPLTTFGLIKQISAGDNHSLLLTFCEKVYGFGSNNWGQVCGSNSGDVYYPQLVSHTTNYHIKAIGAQCNTSVALTSGGQCLVWGKMKDNNLCQFNYLVVNLNSIGKALAQHCPVSQTRHMVSVAIQLFEFSFYNDNLLVPRANNLVKTFTFGISIDKTGAEKSISPVMLEKNPICLNGSCNPIMSRLHRIVDSGPKSDIRFSVLQSDCRSLYVTRWMLQEKCDYFGTMLSDQCLANCKRDSDGKFVIEIGASSWSVYYSYLAFLYSGSLVLREVDQQYKYQVLFDLFDLAHCNGQSALSQLCINRLFQDISIDNYSQLYQISSLYGPQVESKQKTLMDVSIKQFIANNRDLILQRISQFGPMDNELKMLVLQSSSYNTQSEPS